MWAVDIKLMSQLINEVNFLDCFLPHSVLSSLTTVFHESERNNSFGKADGLVMTRATVISSHSWNIKWVRHKNTIKLLCHHLETHSGQEAGPQLLMQGHVAKWKEIHLEQRNQFVAQSWVNMLAFRGAPMLKMFKNRSPSINQLSQIGQSWSCCP